MAPVARGNAYGACSRAGASHGSRCTTASRRTTRSGDRSGRRSWPAATYRSLTDISATVARLILAACLRRATTAGELRRALGVPAGYIDLLDEDLPLTEELLGGVRADILLADGTPYVVEANIDSALGGAHDSDGVARRFLAAYAGDPVLDAVGLTAPPSAVDARYEAVRAALGLTEADRLAMVFTTGGDYPGSQDGLAMIKLLEPFSDRGRELGLDMRVYPVEWLTLDDARPALRRRRPDRRRTADVRPARHEAERRPATLSRPPSGRARCGCSPRPPAGCWPARRSSPGCGRTWPAVPRGRRARPPPRPAHRGARPRTAATAAIDRPERTWC